VTSETPLLSSAIDLVSREVRAAADDLASAGADEWGERAAAALGDAERVFVLGAGRSGIALRMTAMRLMHLGLDVHVVGDATTPAVARGDVLLVASGSGATAGLVRSASTAKSSGATILAVSAVAESPLAKLADHLLVVSAATKLDRSGTSSEQYAGSLFEQSVVIIGDALFDLLRRRRDISAERLWRRHANLE